MHTLGKKGGMLRIIFPKKKSKVTANILVISDPFGMGYRLTCCTCICKIDLPEVDPNLEKTATLGTGLSLCVITSHSDLTPAGRI
jgi:hypothetical protein